MATFSSGRQLPVLCMFYEQGYCKAGDTCRFTHGKSDQRELVGNGVAGPGGPAASIPGQCKFFARGKCSKGQSCPFLHSRYSADEDHRRRSQAQRVTSSGTGVPWLPPPPRARQSASSSSSARASVAALDTVRRDPPASTSRTTEPPPHDRSSRGIVGEGAPRGSRLDDDQEVAEEVEELEMPWPARADDDGVYFYGTPGAFDGLSDRRRSASGGGGGGGGAPAPVSSWRAVVTGGAQESGVSSSERLALDSPAGCESLGRERHEAANRRICTYFLRGMCRFGDRCRHSHDGRPWGSPEGDGEDASWEGWELPPEEEDGVESRDEDVLAAAREASLDQEERDQSLRAECGVCLERVKDRFGILVGCAHVYCLECIREWRRQSKKRECPQCRVLSHFVVPSVKLVTDLERKERLVKEYKESLAVIPCQHFEYGVSECPFGGSCFYAHLKPDGTPADPPRPRIRLNEAGGSEAVREVILSSFLDNGRA